MYRDNLEAAMERTRALEDKVSGLEGQRDVDQAELADLRWMLARQKAEIQRLRELVEQDAPEDIGSDSEASGWDSAIDAWDSVLDDD
jgi:multidrug resistance efflux pump